MSGCLSSVAGNETDSEIDDVINTVESSFDTCVTSHLGVQFPLRRDCRGAVEFAHA